MLETNPPAQMVAKARCRNGRNGETRQEGKSERQPSHVQGTPTTSVDSPLGTGSGYPASMSRQQDLLDLRGERPELERPFLVVHLAGWTDAGAAGQTAMSFLGARWNAHTIGQFDSDELIDYRARRPIVRLASGTIEAVTWSEIELSMGSTVDGLRDALLLGGPEPDFRWHAFADRVTKLCLELGVTEVFGLGAFPAPSLHTDPVAVVSTSADPDLAGRLETVPAIIELAAGIQSVLEERLHQAGIPTTGLWARVPPYLAGGGPRADPDPGAPHRCRHRRVRAGGRQQRAHRAGPAGDPRAAPDRRVRGADPQHGGAGRRAAPALRRGDRRRAGALPLPGASTGRRQPIPLRRGHDRRNRDRAPSRRRAGGGARRAGPAAQLFGGPAGPGRAAPGPRVPRQPSAGRP